MIFNCLSANGSIIQKQTGQFIGSPFPNSITHFIHMSSHSHRKPSKDRPIRQINSRNLNKNITKGSHKIQTKEAAQPLSTHTPIIEPKRQTRSAQHKKKAPKGQQRILLRRQNKKREMDFKQKDTEPQRIQSPSSKGSKKDKKNTRLKKDSLRPDSAQKETKTQIPLKQVEKQAVLIVPQRKKQVAKENQKTIETKSKNRQPEQDNKYIKPEDKAQTKGQLQTKEQQRTKEQLHTKEQQQKKEQKETKEQKQVKEQKVAKEQKESKEQRQMKTKEQKETKEQKQMKEQKETKWQKETQGQKQTRGQKASEENAQISKSSCTVKPNKKSSEQLRREKQLIDRIEAEENIHQQQIQKIHKKNKIQLNQKGIEFGMSVPQKILFQQHLPKGFYFKRVSKQWNDQEGEQNKEDSASFDDGEQYQPPCEAYKNVPGLCQIVMRQRRPIIRTIEQMEKVESESSNSSSVQIDWSAELKAPGDLDYLYQPDYKEDEEDEAVTEKQSKRLTKQEKQNKKDKFLYQKQIIKDLRKQKLVSPFLMPVDEERDFAPGYYSIIKNPIDLRTIEKKLNNGAYSSEQQFYDDMERMWQNSFEYNHACPRMIQITTTLQRYYRSFLPSHLRYQSNEEYAKKGADEQKEGRNKPKSQQSEAKKEASDG